MVIKRELKSLTIYSFIGFLTVIYIMVVTVYYTFDPASSNYFTDYDKIKAFQPLGCLTTFPVFIFSFTTQINLLQCFEELELPTLRRMHKVLAKQHFLCFTIYLFIGMFGYLSFPVDDPDAGTYIMRYNALTNLPVLVVPSNNQGNHSDDFGDLCSSAF